MALGTGAYGNSDFTVPVSAMTTAKLSAMGSIDQLWYDLNGIEDTLVLPI